MARQPKRQRRLRPTTILTDEEVSEVGESAQDALGADIVKLMRSLGLEPEESARMSSLANRVSEARCKRGLSVKEAAAQMKMPQYRLKDIEAGMVNRIRGDVLEQYVRFLGLKRWVAKWAAANPDLATKLGVSTRRRRRKRASGSAG
jgi:DNA-binding Xre family transcriptional regulator